eukprot:477768_1
MTANVLTTTDIDNILDEIENRESKINQHVPPDNDYAVNWDEIVNAIGNINIGFIKNLITSNDIGINEQNPSNGKTLLIYSVIIDSQDLVKLICNFGADVDICDNEGRSALTYSSKFGLYKITELLYFRKLSGSLGNDLKQIATKMHSKNKEAVLLKKFMFKQSVKIKDKKYSWGDDCDVININLLKGICEFMKNAIKNRHEFSPDMLFYAWYFTISDDVRDRDKIPMIGEDENDKNKKKSRKRRKKLIKPMDSPLWKQMMETFESILRNTSDKHGWQWLRNYFVNSLIWYLPHPKNGAKNVANSINTENMEENMEEIVKTTMFNELLIRVKQESKRQSKLLLKEKINSIKYKNSKDWNILISYNVNSKHSSNARQDECGCLLPKYKQNELSIYPPSTHFSAIKHYDTKLYLNELIFKANIMDSLFQTDVKKITKQISFSHNLEVDYRAGPVKTLKRSQTKVENDYINEDYPKSAKLLDCNRCALQFNSIASLMKYICVFTEMVKHSNARSIIDIIRCKNGWSIYDENEPKYTDIKLNVLVQSSNNETIIAEMQFLLSFMSAFKKKAHKLYSVERKLEMIYSYGLLSQEMKNFNDNNGRNAVIIDLANADELNYFQPLWSTIRPNCRTLVSDTNTSTVWDGNVWITALFHIIKVDGKINNFLKTQYKQLYYKTIYNYWTNYLYRKEYEKYGYGYRKKIGDKVISAHEYNFETMIDSIGVKCKDENSVDGFLLNLLNTMFDLTGNDSKQLMKMLLIGGSTTLFATMCKHKYRLDQSISLILNTSKLNDRQKLKLLCRDRNTPFCYAAMDCYGRYAFYNGYPQTKDKLLRVYTSGIVVSILNYVSNDKRLLLQLLKQRYPYNSQESNKSALMLICQSKDINSTKLLTMILQNPLLTEEDKYYLFFVDRVKMGRHIHNAVLCAYLSDESRNNFMLLFEYFSQYQKEIIQLISIYYHKQYGKDHFWNEIGCIIDLLGYIKNDRGCVKKLISPMLIENLCKNKDNCNVLQYLLHQTIFNYKIVIEHIKENPSPACHISNVNTVLEYIGNDRQTLLNMLWHQNENDDILFTVQHIILILNKSCLNCTDVFKLLYHLNNDKKTVLGQRGVWKEIIQYFENNKQINLLSKLLLQRGGDNIMSIVLCKQHTDMEHILDIIDNKTRKKIFSVPTQNFHHYSWNKEYQHRVQKVVEKYKKHFKLNQLLEKDNIEEKELMTLLSEKDKNGKQIFDYLMDSNKMEDLLKFIIYSSPLTDENKMLLLQHKFNVHIRNKYDKKWKEIKNISSFGYAIIRGYAGIILKWFQNNRQKLKQLLCCWHGTYEDTAPLMLLCQYEEFDTNSNSLIHIILHESALNTQNKIQFLSSFKFDIFKDSNNVQNVKLILEYLKENDNQNMIIKSLISPTNNWKRIKEHIRLEIAKQLKFEENGNAIFKKLLSFKNRHGWAPAFFHRYIDNNMMGADEKSRITVNMQFVQFMLSVPTIYMSELYKSKILNECLCRMPRYRSNKNQIRFREIILHYYQNDRNCLKRLFQTKCGSRNVGIVYDANPSSNIFEFVLNNIALNNSDKYTILTQSYSSENTTPLLWSCAHAQIKNITSILDFLLMDHVLMNKVLLQTNKIGSNALLYCIGTQNEKMILNACRIINYLKQQNEQKILTLLLSQKKGRDTCFILALKNPKMSDELMMLLLEAINNMNQELKYDILVGTYQSLLVRQKVIAKYWKIIFSNIDDNKLLLKLLTKYKSGNESDIIYFDWLRFNILIQNRTLSTV